MEENKSNVSSSQTTIDETPIVEASCAMVVREGSQAGTTFGGKVSKKRTNSGINSN